MTLILKPYHFIYAILLFTFLIAVADNDYFEIFIFFFVILSILSTNAIKEINIPVIILIYLLMVFIYFTRDIIQTTDYRKVLHYHNLFRGPLIAILLISMLLKHPNYLTYIKKFILILNIVLLIDIILETLFLNYIDIPWHYHAIIKTRSPTIFLFPHRAAIFSFFSLLILSKKPFDFPAIVCVLSIFIGGSRAAMLLVAFFYILNSFNQTKKSNLKVFAVIALLVAIYHSTIIEGIRGKFFENRKTGQIKAAQDILRGEDLVTFSYSSDTLQNIYIYMFGRGSVLDSTDCKFKSCVELMPSIYEINTIGILADMIPLYGLTYLSFFLYLSYKLNKYIIRIKGDKYAWYSYFIILINMNYTLILETPMVDIMWITFAVYYIQYNMLIPDYYKPNKKYLKLNANYV